METERDGKRERWFEVIFFLIDSWIFNVPLVYYVKRTNHMCTKSQYILSKTNKQEIIILQVSYLLDYSSAFKVA